MRDTRHRSVGTLGATRLRAPRVATRARASTHPIQRQRRTARHRRRRSRCVRHRAKTPRRARHPHEIEPDAVMRRRCSHPTAALSCPRNQKRWTRHQATTREHESIQCDRSERADMHPQLRPRCVQRNLGQHSRAAGHHRCTRLPIRSRCVRGKPSHQRDRPQLTASSQTLSRNRHCTRQRRVCRLVTQQAP